MIAPDVADRCKRPDSFRSFRNNLTFIVNWTFCQSYNLTWIADGLVFIIEILALHKLQQSNRTNDDQNLCFAFPIGR
jgi:hypothetical protein